MSFAGILRKLFQNAGAGPLLRQDILPVVTEEAPGAVPLLGDPGDVLQISAARRPVWGKGSGVPSGCILLWSGDNREISFIGGGGWALCDGKNGTPDLRDRFVIGAGGAYAVGATGGAASATPAVTVGAHTLTTGQMPYHSHDNGIIGNYYNGWSAHSGDGSLQQGSTGGAGGGGSHAHSASAKELSLLPPYYALCYIMKL